MEAPASIEENTVLRFNSTFCFQIQIATVVPYQWYQWTKRLLLAARREHLPAKMCVESNFDNLIAI
jgi:hypothetical protein